MSHPVLFHSSVFVSAETMESMSRKDFSPLYYAHKGRAIQLVNTSLNDPKWRTSDEIIAAVLLLANSEAS